MALFGDTATSDYINHWSVGRKTVGPQAGAALPAISVNGALALARLLPTRDPASLLLAGALFAIFGAAPALLSSLPATARQRVSGYLR